MIQFVVQLNNMIIISPNGRVLFFQKKIFKRNFFSPEEIRGTADVFYLRPLTEQVNENSIWYSNESLSPTIIDQILNRLKLLPEFYTQTKPVETSTVSSNGNNTVTSTTTPSTTNN